MRKNFTKKIVSLAICASACMVMGVATMSSGVKAKAAAPIAITEIHTVKGFKISETAAIRKVTPGGIRFATGVSEKMQAQIIRLHLI